MEGGSFPCCLPGLTSLACPLSLLLRPTLEPASGSQHRRKTRFSRNPQAFRARLELLSTQPGHLRNSRIPGLSHMRQSLLDFLDHILSAKLINPISSKSSYLQFCFFSGPRLIHRQTDAHRGVHQKKVQGPGATRILKAHPWNVWLYLRCVPLAVVTEGCWCSRRR